MGVMSDGNSGESGEKMKRGDDRKEVEVTGVKKSIHERKWEMGKEEEVCGYSRVERDD